MPYPSKSSLVLDQQLQVQELMIQVGTDLGLYTQAGAVVTTCLLGEPVLDIYSAELLPVSAGGDVVCTIAASNVILYTPAVVNSITVTPQNVSMLSSTYHVGIDSQMQITFASTPAAGDVLRLSYVTQQ